MQKSLFLLSFIFLFSCQKEFERETLPVQGVALNGSTNTCTGDYYVSHGSSAKITFLNHLNTIQQLRNSGDTTPKIICLDNDVEIEFFDSDKTSGEFFNLPEGVTLKSNGARFISNLQNDIAFSKIENSNITIDGITFKGGLSLTNWQKGFYVVGTQQNIVQNITIKNCDISGFNQFAIGVKYGINITIENNYIHHNFGVAPKGNVGYGAGVFLGSNVEIINNRFLYNRHAIASGNLGETSYYLAKGNVVLAEYESDPIVRNYSGKQELLNTVLNSAHHFDAHGIDDDGTSGTGGSTGTFTIEQNTFYNTRPFSTNPENKIISIRGVPRDCSSIINNIFPVAGNEINIRQHLGDNSYVKTDCSNNSWKNISVGSNSSSTAPLSSEVDNLVVVKDNGDLINYPLLTDLGGEGVLVGNGFSPATYKDYFVGNWTGNGTPDFVIRNAQGQLRALKFNGTTFYGQKINNVFFPIVEHGFSETNYTDYFPGNWTNNGTSDLIIRNSQGQLRALKFSGSTFYGQKIDGVKFPVVSHGFSETNYTDYFPGNWTNNGTSDLIIRNSQGQLRALKFNGTTFYGQKIDGIKFPVVASGVDSSYTDFLVADWTNDGISDLLMIKSNGEIRINKFSGKTFKYQTINGHVNPVNVFNGDSYEEYYVGEFTGDQYPDLLVVNAANDLFLLKYDATQVKFGAPVLVKENFSYHKIFVANWNN